MKVYCYKCGGEEFQVSIPATVIVFIDSSGQIERERTGDVYDIPRYIENVEQYRTKTYYCTSCGEEVMVEN